MSPNLTTFNPPASLAFKHNMSWILKESAMIAWHDPQETRVHCLGMPWPVDGRSQVTLWVGQGQGEESVVVLLQMTISIKVSSRKKSFDLFLILPSHKLCVEAGGDLPAITVKEIPSNVHECIVQSGFEFSESKRLLALKIESDGPSRVLMNIQPEGAKPVTGTPLHLMLLFKSLSEASEFDIYLGYSSYAKESLRTLHTALDAVTSTTEVDMHQAYNGKGGCFDSWQQYSTEHFSSGTSVSTKSRKRPRYDSPEITSLPPPDVEQEAGRVDPCPPPPYPLPHKAPRLASPFAPVVSDVQVLVEDSDYVQSPAYALVEPSEFVPETPQVVSAGADTALDPVARTPGSDFMVASEKDHLDRFPLPPSTHLNEEVNTTLQCSLTAWIRNMRTVHREFYQVPRLHQVLLSLADAALHGDLDQFIKSKARGTTIVLTRAAALESRGNDNTLHQVECLNLLHEVEKLMCWMYNLRLNADGVMLPFLRNMTLSAVACTRHVRSHPKSKEAGQQDAEATRLQHTFSLREAECISRFYVSLVEGEGDRERRTLS